MKLYIENKSLKLNKILENWINKYESETIENSLFNILKFYEIIREYILNEKIYFFELFESFSNHIKNGEFSKILLIIENIKNELIKKEKCINDSELYNLLYDKFYPFSSKFSNKDWLFYILWYYESNREDILVSHDIDKQIFIFQYTNSGKKRIILNKLGHHLQTFEILANCIVNC